MIYKAILTVEDDNGVFPEVGMSHRMILAGSREKILKTAKGLTLPNERYRIELFNPERLYSNPLEVIYASH